MHQSLDNVVELWYKKASATTMSTNMPDRRKTLALQFETLYGVSLEDCAKNPSVLMRLFAKTAHQHQQTPRQNPAVDYGRGYPFMEYPRASAQEADAKNLEILSKW